MAKSGIAGGDGVDRADLVAAAADELYGADPGEFTDRRKALAGDARTAGDAAAAKRIAALRKPTRAAWVVNQLARTDPGAPGALARLAADLRAAEAARDGHRLRELSASRGPLVDGLTAQALAAAGVPDPPSALREEVAATLTAAIADPGVAADFAAGALTRAAQWAGFGLASFPGAAPGDGTSGGTGGGTDGTEAVEGAEPAAGETHSRKPGSRDAVSAAPAAGETAGRSAGAGRRLRSVPSPRATAPTRSRTGRSAAAPGRLPEEQQARRARAEQERLAEEAAQRAAQRRQAYQEAERAAAAAAAAAAEAGAAEDQLEAEVRDLEQRLTQARVDLAAARMRARRGEAAERRARQALDRLPHPD